MFPAMTPRTREAGAFSKPVAAALAVATLAAPTLAALAERPMTHHWGTRVWYALLRKPAFTPPHHVYPVAWQLIDGVLAWGAWRLARQPATRGRNRALGLLGASVAMIAGWPRIFFAKRELGAAALGSGALTATAARNQQRPLGHAVAGPHRSRREAVRAERCGEAFDRAGKHRLGPDKGELPA